ncbi:MAG: hypothetical protein HY726_20630 [Candidatus Rokubacteria bacterium]|nr:hypothetical protein [Candidatus Rokubacteria bacterium]
MSIRLEVDFHHGLAQPAVEQAPDGGFRLSFTRGVERLDVRLSLPSLEALYLALMLALARLTRC